MWANVMQYVGGEGISVGELHARSRTTADSLNGLERWNYVVVTPAAAASGVGRASRQQAVVRATSAGGDARAIWIPLAAEVEARWVRRLGREAVEDLRGELEVVRRQFEVELPQYLPIVAPTQNGKAGEALLSEPAGAVGGTGSGPTRPPDLSVLLAQVLLQFALDYEAEARVSLTIAANTLRVLDETGVAVRELPRLTGVSKEANSMALGFLARHGCVVLEPDPSARRGKRVRLTPKGKKSHDKYRRVLAETEARWQDRFGVDNLARLRRSLLHVVGDRGLLRESVLSEGLMPYPDGWRATTIPAETLPHYPMVLHRGAYPDGS